MKAMQGRESESEMKQILVLTTAAALMAMSATPVAAQAQNAPLQHLQYESQQGVDDDAYRYDVQHRERGRQVDRKRKGQRDGNVQRNRNRDHQIDRTRELNRSQQWDRSPDRGRYDTTRDRRDYERRDYDRRDWDDRDRRRDDRWRDNRRDDWARYRRNEWAERRYNWGRYYGPAGYRYQRWNYGDFLPGAYWASQYWINNFIAFGLMAPPAGLIWVRYGSDALLIDRYTGEVVQVRYNVFY